MSKFDVRAEILKTGEIRVYPEAVFNNISDDTENPLRFIEYVDLPVDNAPSNFQPQQAALPELSHSQIIIEELIRLREENNKLKALQSDSDEEEQPEKKKAGRPKKETA